MPKIYAIGDSIVHGLGDEKNMGGWPGRLASVLSSDFTEVVNLGIVGAQIKNLTEQLSAFRLNADDILIVGCGTNDAMTIVMNRSGRSREFAASSVERTRSHFLETLASIQPRFDGQVVVTSLLPVDETKMPMAPVLEDSGDRYMCKYTNDSMAAHNQVIRDISEGRGLTFVDSWTPWQKGGFSQTHLSDGLHPNGYGYGVIAGAVYSVLKL